MRSWSYNSTMNDKTASPIGELNRIEFQAYLARLTERVVQATAKAEKAENTLDSISSELHLLKLKVYELECEVARLKHR